jgi:hypothetical protein
LQKRRLKKLDEYARRSVEPPEHIRVRNKALERIAEKCGVDKRTIERAGTPAASPITHPLFLTTALLPSWAQRTQRCCLQDPWPSPLPRAALETDQLAERLETQTDDRLRVIDQRIKDLRASLE